MKRELHSRLLLLLSGMALVLAAAAETNAEQAVEQPVINKAATVKFVPFPNLPDCGTGAVERGDPGGGPSVILFKLTPGCAVPWHWHTPNEHVMMVSGQLEAQMKGEKPVSLRRGDFALLPSRHVHLAKCSAAAPCTMFLYSDGAFDIHYVEEAGQEIPADQALKGANKSAPHSKHQ